MKAFPTTIASHPTRPLLAVASGNEAILIDLTSGSPRFLPPVPIHSAPVRGISLGDILHQAAEPQPFLATVSDDKLVALVHINQKDFGTVLTRKKLTCCVFSSSTLLAADKVGDVWSWQCSSILTESARPTKRTKTAADEEDEEGEDGQFVAGHLSHVTAMEMLNVDERQYLLTATKDNRLRVSQWPNAFVEEAILFHGHTFVSCMATVPHSNGLVVTGAGDGVVSLWNAPQGDLLSSLLPLPHAICSVSVSLDGNKVAVGVDGDNVLRFLRRDGGLLAWTGTATLNGPVLATCVDCNGCLWVAFAGRGGLVAFDGELWAQRIDVDGPWSTGDLPAVPPSLEITYGRQAPIRENPKGVETGV